MPNYFVTRDDEYIKVTEHHLHSRERWLGARAGWDGTDEVNAASNDSLSDFRLDAGNDTWGTALCIVGSADTPVRAGEVSFDFHRLMVSSTERTAKYRLRIAWGSSYAAAITAGNFSETEFISASNQIDSGPIIKQMPRLAAGTKVFAAVWCVGQDTGWIDFTVGLHEYEVQV